LARYLSESRAFGNSALLAAPIVLAYEVGLLFVDERGVRNAADAIIDQGLGMLGRTGALAVNLFVLLAFTGLAIRAASRKATPIGLFVLVVLESGCYACLLAPALMTFSRAALAAPEPPAGLDGVVLSLGAGFYEEAVFRLGAIGGPLLLLGRRPGGPGGWVSLAILSASAVAFSLFHHVGPGAEPYSHAAFLVRTAAGLALGALYVLRGFGVACYTHVIYDVLCMSTR
jgi:hypothetical protein